jgi:tetratricopeptide (TPR) repeat protein
MMDFSRRPRKIAARWMGTAPCILLILLLVPLSCTSIKGVKRNTGEALMYGMIYNDENVPVSGVVISSKGIHLTVSDVQGRFILSSRQRKEVEITLEKTGYEPVTTAFRFEPMDVIHLVMVTADQLVNRAEVAMDEGRYQDAANLCDRALILDGSRIDAPYLKALGLVRLRRYDEAQYLLEELAARIGEREYIRKVLEELKK